MKIITVIKVFTLAFAVLGLSLLNWNVAEAGDDKPDKKDIVDTANEAGQFSTLVSALEAAGLVATLQGSGPFTVFAPSDAAFAKLPDGTLDSLLEDKEHLTAILTYHVVPGKVMAADVVNLSEAKTVNGQAITIKNGNEGVQIDNARVVATDVIASNGVIHVIDSVLIPK